MPNEWAALVLLLATAGGPAVCQDDSGESHHRSLEEWPVVLIGDLGGRLKSAGRSLQYPAYRSAGHRTMSNLYLTLLQAAGAPRENFGLRDPGLKDVEVVGPLPELPA